MQPIGQAVEPWIQIRCPVCDHWLLSRRGGGEQELPCRRCRRLVRIQHGGRAVVSRDLVAGATSEPSTMSDPAQPAASTAPTPEPREARATPTSRTTTKRTSATSTSKGPRRP